MSDSELDFPGNQRINYLFVRAIKKHPVLYDNTLASYSSKYGREKNDAWKEIANEFGTTVHAMKLKWKGLRTVFNRELKKNKSSSSSYYLFNEMKFIIPFKKDNYSPRKSNIKNVRQRKQSYQNIHQDYTEEESGIYNLHPSDFFTSNDLLNTYTSDSNSMEQDECNFSFLASEADDSSEANCSAQIETETSRLVAEFENNQNATSQNDKPINFHLQNNKVRTIYLSQDKMQIYQHRDKIQAFQNSDKFQTFPNSDEIQLFQNNDEIQTFQNSHEIQALQDDDEIQTFQNGNETQTFQNGNETQTFQNGDVIETFYDNNESQTLLNSEIRGIENPLQKKTCHPVIIQYVKPAVISAPKNTSKCFTQTSSDEVRKQFILSLLPEVGEMSEKQFRLLKRKMLQMIDNIMNEPGLIMKIKNETEFENK